MSDYPITSASDHTTRTARRSKKRTVAAVVLSASALTGALTASTGTADAAVSAGTANYADTYMNCYYSVVGGFPQNYVAVAALDLRGFDSARIWRHDKATNRGQWTTNWVPASQLHTKGQVPRIGGSAFYVQYYDAQTGQFRGEWARRLDNGSLSYYCG